MKFEIVVTPLLMECGELSSSTGQAEADQRHVFQCGDLTRDYSLSGGVYLGDYCVSGKFVCDGYVNCMLPDKEGIDEDSQFCTANRNYSSHNGNGQTFIIHTAFIVKTFLYIFQKL